MDAPFILGINASHNGACCLLRGDSIIAAVQEERLTRRKRHRIGGSEPALCITYCLQAAGITPRDLARVVVCVQKDRHDSHNDIHMNPLLRVTHNGVPADIISHHLGHAISTFVTSGFSDAAILVADGVGSHWSDLNPLERTARILGAPHGQETISTYHADLNGVRPIEKHLAAPDQWLSRDAWLYDLCPVMPRFRSLGGMYSAVATQIFGDMDEAGKVMGLAPYGWPTYPPEAFYLTSIDGAFLFQDDIPSRFKTRERWPKQKKEYENLAASVQLALEAALLSLLARLRELSQSPRLCMAGGLALNSVANQRIVAEKSFSKVHIIPAADDAGTAIGAAYYGLWQITGRLTSFELCSDGLGRKYFEREIREAVQRTPAIRCARGHNIIKRSAQALAAGRIIGWFQGGAEFGPRALGQRSILCDPRRAEAKDDLNNKVKHRENFRPFAPVILAEYVHEWFDVEGTPIDSPFMLRVARWRAHARDAVPAVVHIDGTGRLQTITEKDGRMFQLLRAFYHLTGIPILLNTSFNIMGEPIVETPADALWALLFTSLDQCVIGDFVVTKSPDLSSILELYPILSDCALALTLLPRRHRTKIRRDEVVAHIRVRRPWGETEIKVTGMEWATLRLLSGLTKIGDLGAKLQFHYPELAITDSDVLLTIARLKRVSVLEVSDVPSQGNHTSFVDLRPTAEKC